MKLIFHFLLFTIICNSAVAQKSGIYPEIKKEQLLNDLDILYQGLDKFHSGMYWYTPKKEVDAAFTEVRNSITTNLNVLEFYKRITPLVSLSREGHTSIYLPKPVLEVLKSETQFLFLIGNLTVY